MRVCSVCGAVLEFGFPEIWVGVSVRVVSVCEVVLCVPRAFVGVSVRVGSVCDAVQECLISVKVLFVRKAVLEVGFSQLRVRVSV